MTTVFVVETGDRDFEFIAGAYSSLDVAKAAVASVVERWATWPWIWTEWAGLHICAQDAPTYYAQEHPPFRVMTVTVDAELETCVVEMV
jgi:hypothetical protein